MTTPALLLTQCVQNDFIQPISRYDAIPNLLHIGYAEALRLMGENPVEGPLARTMKWAHDMPADQLGIIHIRDWHAPGDDSQHSHLQQFGEHCVHDTPGADFAFRMYASDRESQIIDSLTLNDFHGTQLVEALAPYAGQPCRVGIVGVWTEAKVSFLAYELTTRYPEFEIAVCSALTASSSRQHHYQALDQLQRILGVRVLDSVGQFIQYLGGELGEVPLLGMAETHPKVETDFELGDTDRTLVRYLFRDCLTVQLNELSGGYSGNVVAAVKSVNMHGHELVPHVLKIGLRDEMGRERSSFERVQDVMGNNAPQITDFADHGDRGAIKYRYASTGGSFSSTFQKMYEGGLSLDRVEDVLGTVFGEQLMRLYKAATLENCDILELYGMDNRWAGSVRRKVEKVLGVPAEGRTFEVAPGVEVSNICDFYENTLAHIPRRPGDHVYKSYVHGDLNGANIILDDHDNVWLIDFFHTRRDHVLLDLLKFENDLLYIYTKLDKEDDLPDAFAFTDAILAVRDLGAAMPEQSPVARPRFERAWATLRMLRSFYPKLVQTARDPFQQWVGHTRYAVHTLGFFEANTLQKRWALYSAAKCIDLISASLKQSTELRLDWIDEQLTRPGRVALTLLPGRRDYSRSIERDMKVIEQEGVSRVLCLASLQELELHGVGELLQVYRERGIEVLHMPVVDQKASGVADMQAALAWVEEGLGAGEGVLIHCVGGLGRSGMAAAALLKSRGMSAEDALAEVRRARSPRAVETREQEEFVRRYPADS